MEAAQEMIIMIGFMYSAMAPALHALLSPNCHQMLLARWYRQQQILTAQSRYTDTPPPKRNPNSLGTTRPWLKLMPMSLKAWFRFGCIFSVKYSISCSVDTLRMSDALRLLAAGLLGFGHLHILHTSRCARLRLLHLVHSQSCGFSKA